MLKLTSLNTDDPNFAERLQALLTRGTKLDQAIHQVVLEILTRVRSGGDKALLEYTRLFDSVEKSSVAELELPKERLQEALKTIPLSQRQALTTAAARIRAYAEHQKLHSWQYQDEQGNLLGQIITPLERVGLYVPGGKAAYPSSVLMNAIPAKVAGVSELILAVPTPAGEINELVLAAAAIAQVDRMFCIGGAQAIAALAYGTETIPKVDKIVGPGNIYVATAKKLVFGEVGIDLIAGPSEVLIIADGTTDPDWIAMDLFAQAEHDEDAQAILLSPDSTYLNRVKTSMAKLLPQMGRSQIIRTSLERWGALIEVRDLDEACQLANRIAPEHLELAVADADRLLPKLRHAGAIFIGGCTAEALGDYCAGPNHVLPTSATARFSSPLGTYDFQKRTSLVGCSPDGASLLAETARILAEGEGLTAHARSALYRIQR
ncbi:MAG: histidinol dehydrogenase [Methylohalobius sp.]|nr:histidinol dehydrogenase [Methylohalobius sp.]